ncbi:MAG: MCE family protein [Burkholderiaceae bacterium]|nr:MCE family protein [Burkholderiaceae bacterium]
MEDKVNLTVVGAFVIALTVTLIGLGLYIASGTYQRKVYDAYETYMTESVAGLNVNAAVRYRGVDVGRVRRIMLAPGNVEQVRVSLDIERGTPVKTDTLATLQTQGLTGIAYVELKGGRKESPALQAAPGQDLPVIASDASLIERLETAAPVLMANLARAVDNLNAVLDENNRRALSRTLVDLAALSHTLAGRTSAIDATLAHSARTAEQLARLGAQLPQMVQRYERTADALERMATDVSAASADTRRTLADAGAGFEAARRAIGEARAEVVPSAGSTLAETRELIGELRELTGNVRRMADELERNPALLLQGRRTARRGPGE